MKTDSFKLCDLSSIIFWLELMSTISSSLVWLFPFTFDPYHPFLLPTSVNDIEHSIAAALSYCFGVGYFLSYSRSSFVSGYPPPSGQISTLHVKGALVVSSSLPFRILTLWQYGGRELEACCNHKHRKRNAAKPSFGSKK